MAKINLNSSGEGDYRLEVLNKLLLDEQNYNYAALGGLAAAAVGAWLWYELLYIDSSGWVSFLIAPAVATTIRLFGKGREITFGVLAVVLSLLSCLFGQFLINAYLVSLGVKQTVSYVLLNDDVISLFGSTLEGIPFFTWIFIIASLPLAYFPAFRFITKEDKLRVGIVE